MTMLLKPSMNFSKVAWLTAWINVLLVWCHTSPIGLGVACTILATSITRQKTVPSKRSLTLSDVRTSYLKVMYCARKSILVTGRVSLAVDPEDHCIVTSLLCGGKKKAVPLPLV